MDDDDEIKRLIRKESEAFLKHALFQARGPGGVYDIGTEFAKTRRRKSYRVFGATGIFIVCLAAAAFAVTKVIELRSASAPVSVSAFEDLNLRDILDASKRDDSALERARLRLARLGAELSTGLEFVDRAHAAALESIAALDLSPDSSARRTADAAAMQAASKARLQDAYAVSAALVREDMATVRARIDRYDSRSLEKAKQEKAILDGERLAFDIEKNQLTQLYDSRLVDAEAGRKRDLAALELQKQELAAAITSRYNPSFDDPRSSALISELGSGSTSPLPPFDPYLVSAGVLEPQAAATLDSSIVNLEYLSSRLRAVPYLNSIPPALARIEEEATSSAGAYRAALQSAASVLKARDSAISALGARAEAAEASLGRYRDTMSTIVREAGASGLILDARDGAMMPAFMDPALAIPDGSLASISRDGKLLASALIYVRDGDYYVSVTKLEGRARLRNFDAIVAERAPANGPVSMK